MIWHSSQIAAMMHGSLHGENQQCQALSMDSRLENPQGLFLSFRGEKFDSHAFLEGAIQKGAVACVVDKKWFDINSACLNTYKNTSFIVVNDTHKALLDFAKAWRAQSKATIIGITGSSGKTSTKEMITSVLKAHAGEEAVLATTGNLNNAVGMPQTLLKLKPEHRYAVIEVGINHPNEMAILASVMCPDIALVTNAGAAHLKGLGSVEQVAHEKGQLYKALTKQGVAIINSDDAACERWREMSKHCASQVFFGRAKNPSTTIEPHPRKVKINTAYLGQPLCIELPTPGWHQAQNALAAIAVAQVLKINPSAVKQGLEQFHNVQGRLQFLEGVKHGQAFTVIHDAYNANPDSMRAAIDVLAAQKPTRLLIMGDMGELGHDAVALHRALLEQALNTKIETIFLIGEQMKAAYSNIIDKKEYPHCKHYEALETLIAAIDKHIEAQSPLTILVKGSRFMALERVVYQLIPTLTQEVH